MNADGSMARLNDLQKFATVAQSENGQYSGFNYLPAAPCKNAREATNACNSQPNTASLKRQSFKTILLSSNTSLWSAAHLSHRIPCLVRVHGLNRLRDILLEDEQAFSWSLGSALQYIQSAGTGVVILLNTGESNEFSQEVHKMNLYGASNPTEKPLKYTVYDVGLGAQILNQLGVRNLRILGAPANYKSLSAYGIEIIEYIQFQQNLVKDTCLH